jgi:MFS family permease
MLGLLTFAYVLSFVDRLIVTVVVEPLKADLLLSDVQIALLQGTAFAVFYAIMGVPLGRLADAVNRKRLIAAGVLLWSIATMSCGLSTTFAGLFMARVLVGVGEAALSPAAYSMFADTFPRDRLARVIGIYSTGGALGNGIALLAGGALLKWFAGQGDFSWPLLGTLAPWQSTFVVVGLPGIAVAALVLFSLREPPRVQHGALPSLGDVAGRLRGGRKAYVPIFVSWSLNAVVGYAYISWAPVHLIRSFGLDPGDAGMLFGIVMIACGVAGPILGGLACDLGTRRGMGDAPLRVTQWGFVLLVVLGATTFIAPGLALTLALMCGMTLVFTGLLTLGPVAIQLITPGRMRGQMTGVNLMVGNIAGLGLGPLLAAILSDTLFAGEIGRGVAVTVCLASMAGAVIAWQGRPALAYEVTAQRTMT